MIVLAIILAILTLIALLRFGVSVEYGESGVFVTVLVGPLSLKVLPSVEKPISEKKKAKLEAREEEKARKKAEKKAQKKAEKEARKKAEKEAGKKLEDKKPGVLKTVLDLLPAVKNMLGRLRRRLLIKRLIIYYSVANDDPYKAAFTFGAANAAIGVLVPFLENNFRIRKRDFRAFPNFHEAQQSIYINAAISLAVWEVFYMAFAILPAGVRILLNKNITTDRKDGKKNGREDGQGTNKRLDGNDNAESQGDDRR